METIVENIWRQWEISTVSNARKTDTSQNNVYAIKITSKSTRNVTIRAKKKGLSEEREYSKDNKNKRKFR